MKKYPVIEQFDSIQGEGCMIGMPVTFIRLAGCNLHCPWCDSKETWKDPETLKQLEEEEVTEMFGRSLGFTWRTGEELAEECLQRNVIITGGEPCIHDLTELIQALHSWDKIVCLETNGTLPTPPSVDWVVASPKPNEYFLHPECRYDELKYVVDDTFNVSAVPEELINTEGRVWLQPCDYTPMFKEDKVQAEDRTKNSYKKCVDLVMKYPYLRAGIQLHKVFDVK